MNCCNCSSQFDHSLHVPRLLIFCGHSLCQGCCKQLHVNSRIQCPQCLSNTFIQQVIFLPKNLALLKVNSPPVANNNSFCLKHEKKYQAFCKKQKLLICVDCILHDNHRNHEMDTIKNAYIVQQSDLKETIHSVQSMLNSTQNKYEDNLNNQKHFFDTHESNCEILMQYFHELREIIDKEQDLLLNKLKQSYDSAVLKYQEKNSRFLSRIEELSVTLASLREGNKLSEVQFLFTVNQRHQIACSLGHQLQQSLKLQNISHNKNSIGQLVIKSIQKNFKISNQSVLIPQGNKTPQTNPKAKKMSTHHITSNQQYQSLKQYESLTMPTNQNNQNQKPMAKKMSKKEQIPTVTAGIMNLMNKNSPNPPLPFNKSNVNSEQKKSQVMPKQKVEKQRFQISRNCDISIVEQKQSLFNSFFSNMTSFLTEHKYIYVVGGFDEQTSNIIKLNLNSYKWEQVANLKAPWSKFGCVAVDKNIFIMGGKKGRERVSDIQVWNHGNWNSQYTLKKKRSGFGIISYENFIYVIGGNDGENILNTMEILNVLTGEWTRAQSMAQTRDELAVCLGKDQRIYAIGGFGGKNSEPLKSVQMYDIKTQKWYRVPSLNIQRRALAAASLADGIYAIGGFDGTKHLNSVQKYEQGSSSWIKIADLKRGRCTHSAVSVFDTQQIIVLGGFDEQALDSVQKYSLISNEWEQITKMPAPRFMHSCVLLTE